MANDIQWQRQRLVEEDYNIRNVIIPQAEAEARRLKLPDGVEKPIEFNSDGTAIQSGDSGTEMVESVAQYALRLNEIANEIAAIDAQPVSASRNIRWFRNSVQDKPVKQLSPVTNPNKPKKTKNINPKVKKKFKGPQSPGAYKRKLYVPMPFIHSHLNTFANAGEGYLGMNYLLGLEANNGDIVEMDWIPNPKPCEKCIPTSWIGGGHWDSRHDFENDPNRPKYDDAIFHDHCSCGLRVKVIYDDGATRTVEFKRTGVESDDNEAAANPGIIVEEEPILEEGIIGEEPEAEEEDTGDEVGDRMRRMMKK